MNVAALCSKRGSSNAADPELAMLRGRRFVAFQEPSKDEPINVGKLKEWSGIVIKYKLENCIRVLLDLNVKQNGS